MFLILFALVSLPFDAIGISQAIDYFNEPAVKQDYIPPSEDE